MFPLPWNALAIHLSANSRQKVRRNIYLDVVVVELAFFCLSLLNCIRVAASQNCSCQTPAHWMTCARPWSSGSRRFMQSSADVFAGSFMNEYVPFGFFRTRQ